MEQTTLDIAHKFGIDLSTDGERLFASPADLLTDALRARIREQRADLIATLLTAAAVIDRCRRPRGAAHDACQGDLFPGRES